MIAPECRRVRSAVLALGVLVPVFGLLGSGAVASSAGAAATTSVATGATTTATPLLEFVNDDAGGRLWNDYDQTVNAQGSTITGRPSAVLNGTAVHTFVRAANGDLVEFANDDAGGRLWNAYDVTKLSQGPAIAGDPTALLLGPTEIAVFAESVSGDLVEFLDVGVAQAWVAIDVTNASGGATIADDPSPLVVGTALDVFARSASGHLLEFTGTPTGSAWSSADLTQVSGGPSLAGDPDAVLYGTSSVHVYGEATSGDLTEFVNDGAEGRPWNAYDLTTGGVGPTVGGKPSAVVYGKTVHVYSRAVSGDLTEFVNDGAGGRLWNAYDLTRAADGPAIVGDPGAIRYGASSVHIYVQAAAGDLTEFVNDGAGARLWNSYDASKEVGGIVVGGDPGPVVYGSTVHVYLAGPPPPPVIQQIVSVAQGLDQNNAAVTETPPGSNCNPYTAYFGRGVATGCAPGTSAEEWCADFAEWVWAQAGIPTSGIDGWAYSFVAWGQNHTGAWLAGDDNNPQPGDAVVWGDLSSQYASHVGIVVGVSQGMIDVVSGNSGPPIDPQGDVDAVWDSGYFDPTTSTVDGYPIMGYVSPTGWNGLTAHDTMLRSLSTSKLARDIATQDGGK